MNRVETIIEDAFDALGEQLSVRQISRFFKESGHRHVTTSLITDTLEQSANFDEVQVLGKTYWEMVDPSDEPVEEEDPSAVYARLSLRDWQVEAFSAWVANGCKGVVEAVTGSGKTRLALAALQAAYTNGGKSLVLVPTLDLMDQWVKEVKTLLPHMAVGRLGGGEADDLHSFDVVISTPHAASQVPVDFPGNLGCLIADEAHRYGAETWSEALRDWFNMRLALTATYERSDEGVEDILGPYFGPIVKSYTYTDAAADEVISPFDVVFISTSFDPSEQKEYDDFDRRVKSARKQLVAMGLPQDPQKMFMKASALASQESNKSAMAKKSREYLFATRKRRDVAVNAAGKYVVAKDIARHLAGKSLAFCDTVDQSEMIAKQLVASGVKAETIHSNLTSTKRKIRLAQFKNGNIETVVAPRVLDEGVDVPDADIAVVFAAFRSKRQMIQRMGRVLRLKSDGRSAKLVVVYAEGTNEDPKNGAHKDFIREIVPVAKSVEYFNADHEMQKIHDWFQR